ncbi:MAG TPA: molybdopterin-dependent oxidoreductase [Trebonia sp.]|jgi:DMSO/TMAO reductase YedYZ molybdopterin-dependent catalytic subunit|nr:molybdopterin-dependent oxidoreductase [Trebonia sp.]
MLTVAVALGVAQLMAGITGPLGSPVVAIGSIAISHTPEPVKEFAIAHFGSRDKDALISGIVAILTGAAAVTGVLALKWLRAGLAVLAVFGAAGVAAAVTSPQATGTSALPTLAGIAAGAAALILLTRSARVALGSPSPLVTAAEAGAATGELAPLAGGTAPERPAAPGPERPGPPGPVRGPDRRRFLITGASAVAVAAASGGAGELILGRFNVAASRAAVRLPAPAVAARAVPAGAQLPISGLSPFMTPNSRFYRVDTDLVVPQVAPEDWTLRIDGMVSRPVEITFSELLKMPLTEADVTLVCVSNVVGGPYAGNARWLGVPLAGLLRRAGVQAGADQVLSSGTDGMTISTPLAAIMDGRNALVAVGMNGQPLPVTHGFPARMVVPGLYGYTSATKWLTRLTVTTFARRRAYWTQRGYAAVAPIKTESRIDVPKPLAQVKAGRVPVAGVAWAPHRGISAVEVSVDGGPWRAATLAAADGIDTWRQWAWAWDATPGLHSLRVRAADGAGAVQVSKEAAPFPDGASGWDSVVVTVT